MAESEQKRGRGRPRKQTSVPPAAKKRGRPAAATAAKKRGRPPGAKAAKSARSKRINFNDRKQIEKYASSTLGTAAENYDKLRESLTSTIDSLQTAIQKQSAKSGKIDEFLMERLDSAHSKLLRICDRQVSLVDTLIKRFDILDDLGRGGEDDEGTPVEIVYSDSIAQEARTQKASPVEEK